MTTNRLGPLVIWDLSVRQVEVIPRIPTKNWRLTVESSKSIKTKWWIWVDYKLSFNAILYAKTEHIKTTINKYSNAAVKDKVEANANLLKDKDQNIPKLL